MPVKREFAAGYILRISRRSGLNKFLKEQNITLELKESGSRGKPYCLFIKP